VASGGPDGDWPHRVRLWLDGRDSPIGWGWLNPPATLDWFVRPGLPKADEAAIRSDILQWFEDGIAGVEESPQVWAAEGRPEAQFLVAHAFQPTTTSLSQFHCVLDQPVPAPSLPPGYSVRTVLGTDEIEARVEVHRAAFAPSKLTVAKYEILVGLDHYAFDRDVVVVAPDGTFAAFTMCWWDAAGRIGEFEPVGTHPDHRGRGLAKAANRFGLRLLQRLGATDVIVFSDRDSIPAQRLYRSVGFEEIAIHRTFRRPTG
jgi:ribosomal protein S18 acetylase RimI-like enzyme